VVGSLDIFANDPNSCTIFLPSSNSNENPFANSGLLAGTCSSVGLNSSKASCVATFSICSLVAYRPSCVYYYCYYKCCFNAADVVDLQWSPSNLHIHLHQNVNALHPLETLCHDPS